MNGESYRLKQSKARRRREVQDAEAVVDPDTGALTKLADFCSAPADRNRSAVDSEWEVRSF
jgi:hypothetical protein